MEEPQFGICREYAKTLISDNPVSRVFDWEKEASQNQENKDPAVDEDDESAVEAMICDSRSRLIATGFIKPDCTEPEEYVMFVNAGGEVSKEADSTVNFLSDTCFEGGDVLRTNECITQAGDYPFIYQSARLGNFCYRFNNLLPGDYMVDLHFVEIINTNGPKGMRVFNVFMQEEKVLSDFDIFSIVGANKPLQLVDLKTVVKEDGIIVIRFESVSGSPVVSGVCVRRAPKLSVPCIMNEYLQCKNCAADIEVHSAQKKLWQTKSLAKYEKKIQELTMQSHHKTNECYEAWMSLSEANEQLEKVRMELDNKTFQALSLDRTMEEQAENMRNLSRNYEHDKKFWAEAVNNLAQKIKMMKKEHLQLSCEAHKCTDSIPELNKMIFAVQALVAQCEDLKVKSSEEQAKSRELYNQVQELKGNIRVFCRCRPLSKVDISSRCSTVVDFDTAKDGELGILTGGSNKKTFKFDRVYTPKDNQVDVFADASPLVISVLDGYNVCIFAYGQTGTGKTFTMEGIEQNRGVNYRTLEHLFTIAEERSETFSYNISVSVLEVYNEQIRDLLATTPTSKKLEIKQTSNGSHHVPGIVEAQVKNIKEVWNVLQAGSNARAVGSNNINEHSSRSHCMLCIMVKATNLMNGDCTRSKLWLVDLAGSERLAKTDAQGDRLKEAQNINRSLSALGDVISALATKSSHIPYRNSKLTHLLQDSLGGDAKTLMFVQISPSEKDLGETMSSLNFAARVRGVELGPAKRQIDTGELQKMKLMLDKARQESRLKDESLRKLEDNLQHLESKVKSKENVDKSQQEKIRELESQLDSKNVTQGKMENQVSQLSERLKGMEELCIFLQQKVKETDTKLRERQQSESATFKPKVKELENMLKEQVQESESNTLILQQKIMDLERKLKEHEQSSEVLCHHKVKELDNEYADSLKATPVEKRYPIRDDMINEIENSVNQPMTRRSMYETRQKREFRIGEIDNNIKVRGSEPPKISRVTRTSKPGAQGTTPFMLKKINNRELVQEAKKKVWAR